MKLTKDHLIEGKIFKKGTEVKIKESDFEYSLPNVSVNEWESVTYKERDRNEIFFNHVEKVFDTSKDTRVYLDNGNYIDLSPRLFSAVLWEAPHFVTGTPVEIINVDLSDNEDIDFDSSQDFFSIMFPDL